MNKQPKQRFEPFVRVPLGCSKCYRSAVATRGLVHKHLLLMPYQFHPPARMQTLQKSTRPNFASWRSLVCGGVAIEVIFKHTSIHIQWNSLRLMEQQIWDPFFPHKFVYWMSFFSTQLPETNSGHIQRSKFKMISASKKKTHHKKVVVHDINWLPFWWTIYTSIYYILTTTPLWTCPSHFFFWWPGGRLHDSIAATVAL